MTRTSIVRPFALGIPLAAVGAAHGQGFAANFEPPAYMGSASGTLTTGQNGWYLPSVGGEDHNIFTYAGNTLGYVANPNGGSQFDAGLSVAANGRAQHDVAGFAGGGMWMAEFECNGLYTGTLPTADNLGSFSLQTSTTDRYFQQLMNWGSGAPVLNPPAGATVTNYTATADKFHMAWGHFTAAAPTAITFDLASTAWMDLPVNHWYHVKVTWTFDAANPHILTVAIRDLTAGTPEHTDDVSGLSWYLAGGPGSTLPLATAIRLFSGNLGNSTAWDNVNVQPLGSPVTCYPNCDHSTAVPFLNVNDFICFQQAFAAGDSYANCDQSTTPPVLNVNDFICFQQSFASGCTAP